MGEPSRRDFLRTAGGATVVGLTGSSAAMAAGPKAKRGQTDRGEGKRGGREMKLGIVTYNIAKDWDVDTIIKNCKTVGLEGVEARTTHAHGIEPTLSKAARAEVRRKFQDAGVELVGLGSTCEYHSTNPAELRKQIDETKRFVELAKDVGASGVKVRPNNLPDDVPIEKTIEQIGRSLRECGEFAKLFGVQIRLEVHGRNSSHPPYVKQMMDVANHDNVFVCWNSNDSDMDETGSIDRNFELLAPKIRLVHITELWSKYPWRREFELLHQAGYKGYTLAEIQANADPIRLLRYYRALWLALQPA